MAAGSLAASGKHGVEESGSAAHFPRVVGLVALDRPRRASGATAEPPNVEPIVGTPVAATTVTTATTTAR